METLLLGFLFRELVLVAWFDNDGYSLPVGAHEIGADLRGRVAVITTDWTDWTFEESVPGCDARNEDVLEIMEACPLEEELVGWSEGKSANSGGGNWAILWL